MHILISPITVKIALVTIVSDIVACTPCIVNVSFEYCKTQKMQHLMIVQSSVWAVSIEEGVR